MTPCLRASGAAALALTVLACAEGTPLDPPPPGTAGQACWPVAEGPPIPLSEVTLGDRVGCGLDAEGVLRCWGQGMAPERSGVPGPPLHEGRYVDVEIGSGRTCGVLDDGSVRCSPPLELRGSFDAIELGGDFVCAIERGGTVVCDDMNGGSGRAVVPPAGAYVTLSAGAFHACAIGTDAALECWGAGTSTATEWPHFGQAVAPPGRFTQVVAGGVTSCALDEDRTLRCWGDAMEAPPQGSFLDLDGHGDAYCAVEESGVVRCFGRAVLGLEPPPGSFARVRVGRDFVCAADAADVWTCSGAGQTRFPCDDDDDECGQALPPREVVERCADVPSRLPEVEIVASPINTCLLDSSGRTRCWGLGERLSPQCGNDVTGDFECGQSLPPDGVFVEIGMPCGIRPDHDLECWGVDFGTFLPPIRPGGAIVELPAPMYHPCGLRPDGTIACAGHDEDGVRHPPPGPHRHLAVGHEFACAVDLEDRVTCWGEVEDDLDLPEGDIVELEAGDDFVCARFEDGRIECAVVWLTDSPAPAFLDRYTDLDLSDRHACAVRESDGRVECRRQRAASGPTPPELEVPDARFVAIAAGGDQTCGIVVDGTVRCWGVGPAAEVPPGLIAF